MTRFTASYWALAVVLLLMPGICGNARAADAPAAAPAPPDYVTDVLPVLKQYCMGCHNGDDREGELVMDTLVQLMQGGENGAVIKPGDGEASKLIKVLTGRAKPKMPPKKKPAPPAEAIALLKRWIDAGAKGPAGPIIPQLNTPDIKPADGLPRPITAMAFSPDGKLLAVARFEQVALLTGDKHRLVRRMSDLPGKVNALNFSSDGARLVAATGVNGLYGKAVIWNVADGAVVRQITGHRDTMYDAVLSPDGKLLATCSYDRRIMLWDAATGDVVRTLAGHNDAVYDVAFSPDGKVLASASGDQTVKLWQVSTGQRLDTLHQPTAEQYVVTFSPDGRYVLAGGVDNRIRVWRFVSREEPAINPLVHARFAHEGAIVQLAWARGGKLLVSAAEDRSIKLWETESFTQIHAYEQQPDVPAALAAAPGRDTLVVARMDGSLQGYAIAPGSAAPSDEPVATAPPTTNVDAPLTPITEHEPNDTPDAATAVQAPAIVTGVIHPTAPGARTDADLFRFDARAGQQWVMEIDAARSKSPLDSRLEVLDAGGNRIQRVILQAVRDSYFTFRGKDSTTSDDFRLRNWEEMELNEYLYANGEVVKLWHYPRGPDSGFIVYPGSGPRHGYFDTTPLAHALQEPCYIVRPHPPGAKLIDNGLPLFTLYYENDDDSLRRVGADSRLTFTAPRDGSYLVRVTDVRGFAGPDYKYKLTIRPRRPDFAVKLEDANPTVNAASGKQFELKLTRIDGFDGPVRVDITGVPPGFSATTPLVIEAGQQSAWGVLNALADAPQPTPENAKATKVTATADIAGQAVTKPVNNLGEIKLAAKPKLLVTILPTAPPGAAASGAAGVTSADDDGKSAAESAADEAPPPDQPLVLTIAPGQTITARVRIQRDGFTGRVELGGYDAGRNLPHGVYVDNIGLNGLLIVEGQNQRTFFITAAKWAPPTTRPFFLVAKAEGGQASRPVLLRVVKE